MFTTNAAECIISLNINSNNRIYLILINVSSVLDSGRFSNIRNYIISKKIDLILVQESFLTNKCIQEYKTRFPNIAVRTNRRANY